jgi:hypothetical protein
MSHIHIGMGHRIFTAANLQVFPDAGQQGDEKEYARRNDGKHN